MTKERTLLLMGVLGLVATAPTRVHASDGKEVEGATYGGTTAGGWTCGPAGRVNYAGIGGRYRVTEQPSRLGGKGGTVDVAAAGEEDVVKVVDLERCTSCTAGSPPTKVAVAGQVRVGYQWNIFGFELGGNVFQGWADSTDRRLSTGWLPSAELRLGPHATTRAVVGIGSPFVTTTSRPGFYLGADAAFGSVDLQCRLGQYRAGPSVFEDTSTRFDAVAYLPLTPHFDFRLGGSASSNDVGAGGEASLGLRAKL